MEANLCATALQLRVWKNVLWHQLKLDNSFTDFTRILNIAERICPCSQQFGGGLLFYHWFMENRKKVNWEQAQQEPIWSVGLRMKIMRWEVPRWVMSIVTSTNNMSQKRTNLLFYSSLVLEWQGIGKNHQGISLICTIRT